MIIIAGGVLLALVAFAVLRRVFVPIVMIALVLWLWAGNAHSQIRVDKSLDEAYGDCLLKHGQTGGYISADGGKSAIRLLAQCRPEWNKWVADCIRNGGEDGDCTFRSGLLAQAALKLLGR